MQKCTLAIDVGTGSTRVAIVNGKGQVLNVAAREYDQIVPAYGWSEQRPEDWWTAARVSLKSTTSWARENHISIETVVACGQMHGTVMIDDDGCLTRDTVPLWNDKRSLEFVRDFEISQDSAAWLPKTANPPTPAWPAFKLQWLKKNDPEAWAKTASVFMPKDYINFRLTGERAMDWTEAACSFLMNPETGDWSDEVVNHLQIDKRHLLPIRLPSEILGTVSKEASDQTGLAEGTTVLVGGGDYPIALLGSGVCKPGLASEVAGTSCIITLVTEKPVLDLEISNIGTPEGNWGGFVLLETGGDAARWARRTFHNNELSYSRIVNEAEKANPGADALFFLPYLVGERLGAHRNSRAQFFGLAAGHGLPQLHRAIFEGVGFAVNRHLQVMERATGTRPEVLIASGGGAKADLWLRIKSAIYNRRILIPEEPECGLVGCATLASVATGQSSNLIEATERLVRHSKEVQPDAAWAEHYARMQPIFDRLYESSRQFYNDLDTLSSATMKETTQ